LEISCLVDIYYTAKQAQQVSRNTMKIIRRVMEDFSMWFLDEGYRNVSEISVLTIQSYLQEKELDGCAPNTLSIYFRNLRTFSYWIEDLTEGRIRSPFHNKALRAPRIPSKKKAAVSADQLLDFLKYIDGDYAARNKAFFMTAFDSGLRLAEVCALRISNLDMITGKIEVLQGKGNKYRISFVSGTTLKAIRRYLAGRSVYRESEPLFLSDSGTFLSEQGMQAIRYGIEKKSGIKLGGFHALRRGFAKEFLKNGGDLFTLQNLLGHEEVETTRGYVQLDPDELQAIYERNSPLDQAYMTHQRKR
jgi:site-specific recombinase XerD